MIIWMAVFVGFVLVGAAWSLVQPPFSGVDEIEHFNMGEAVWSGQFIPPLTHGGAQFESGIVNVKSPPTNVRCFIAQAAVPASCDRVTFRQPAQQAPTEDYVSREPLLPAFLTGLPGFVAPNRVGFYLSRVLDSMIAAAGLATAVILALSRRRPFLLVGVLLAATPSVIAGSGVVGNSALEIAAASLLWVAVALLVDGEAPTGRFMLLTGGAAIVLLLSRPVSFIYVGLAAAAVVIAGGREHIASLLRNRAVRTTAVCIAAVTCFAVAWYVFVGAPWNSDFIRLNHLPRRGLGQRISVALGATQQLWAEAVGAIGFNEYTGPWWMTLAWTALTATAVGAGALFTARRRRIVAVAMLVIALLALPVVVQTVVAPSFAPYWMGRYDIPILAGVVILGVSAIDARLGELPELRRLGTTVLFAAPILTGVLFVGTLRRFTVGVNGALDPFAWGSGWRPPLPVLPLIAFGFLALAFSYGVIYRYGQPLLRALTEGRDRTTVVRMERGRELPVARGLSGYGGPERRGVDAPSQDLPRRYAPER